MKWFYGFYPTDRIKIRNKFYYISNFFPEINILFSIWPIISTHKYFYQQIKTKSFRKMFSIQDSTEIIADSGSFSYFRSQKKNAIEWKLNEILKVYEVINPDFGVHNDVPVSFLKNIKNYNVKKLFEKNLFNAKHFLKRTQNKQFKPIGVAQGITENDYINQILQLYHMGYNYIGIGGIAYRGKKRIYSILLAIYENLRIEKLKIRIHVFGVGRLNVLKQFKVDSFDNTSPLNDSHRDKKGKRTYYYTFDEKNMRLIKNPLEKLQKINYKITCKCPICKILSNEIILTGSAKRNHSRAFHNAYIYQKSIDLINK